MENVGIECKELGLAFISNLAQKHNYKFLDDVEQTQPKESKVEEKPVTLSKDRNIWIFQANPDKYDILNALTDPNCNIDGWSIFQYKDKIKIGDIALIWMSGKDAGIYAIAEVISEPFFNSNPAGPDKYRIDEKKFMKERWMAKIKIIKKLINNPILRKELKNIEGLRNLSILRRPEGTNFPVTNSEWEIIKQKIGNPFLILPEKKMAFLLATDSWKKMDIYEDFISEHDKFVWRMGGVYSTQYLEQIRYPINVYFFHRNIVKFRCKCEEIGEIGHNRERFLEDIPIVFHSDNASYSTFLLFTELER
ncbi:MAG: EVE domain-containing protein, partial [Candidatus Omnitrophica bacterium]|nr:EVE domain-containing protein [Candidatus Omnitrophota bacterium]